MQLAFLKQWLTCTNMHSIPWADCCMTHCMRKHGSAISECRAMLTMTDLTPRNYAMSSTRNINFQGFIPQMVAETLEH